MSSEDTIETSKKKSSNRFKYSIFGSFKFSSISVRHDVFAWIGGMLFLLVMMIAIMSAGNAAQWNASSGYKHYNSSSKSRFMPEPEDCNEADVKGRHGEGCTGRWYYWKIPPNQVTALSTAIVWLCYSTHQTLLWIMLFLAQSNSQRNNFGKTQKFGTKLRWYNWALFIINALFFLIHLGQTHWTYDGLAQNVCLASSEGSVILMLGLILVLEYKDRGFMFLWPISSSTDPVGKRIKLNYEPIKVVRKYHGYLICWATTYTFWYHPMENTWGHVLGFIHGGMLFLQGSLIYTRFHLNRYWRLLNEIWVMFHGSFMAFQTRDGELGTRQQWPLYFFGFGFILAFTQIFGLTFWKRIHFGFRVIPPAVFFLISLILCGTGVIRGHHPEESSFARLREIFYIPLEMYLILIAMWFFIYLMLMLEKVLKKYSNTSYNIKSYDIEENTEVTVISNQHNINDSTRSVQDCSDQQNINPSCKNDGDKIDESPSRCSTAEEKNHTLKQALGISGFLMIHALMIVLSYFIQWSDVNMTNSNIMFMMVAIFTVCWSIAAMFAKLALNPVQ